MFPVLAIKLNEVFFHNGETTTIDFSTKYNQTLTITYDSRREYRNGKGFDGWTL